MKKIILTMAVLLGLCGLGSAQKYYSKVKLTNHSDSVSYAVGIILAGSVNENGFHDVSPDAIGKAFRDVIDNNLSMTEDMAIDIVTVESERIVEQKEAEAKAMEKEFLENNAKEPGVKVTESGLQYLVIKEGNGKRPTTDNQVKINYEGKLINGDVFDSSYDNDEPTTLDVDSVIDGMSEGLQLMSEGSEYILYIPYELGYGSYSPGDFLPAYSTLIFSVELISVEDKPADGDTDDEGIQLDLDDLLDD